MCMAIAGTGTKSVGFREKTLPTQNGTATVSSVTVHTRVTTRSSTDIHTTYSTTLPVIITAVLKVDEHQFLFFIILSPFQQQDITCKKVRMT